MFEKTLTDVVKGIRASKRDTQKYISQCIAEIKTEIDSTDLFVKANALQKLTFLQMMGYSMNWAAFQTVEVMSSSRFSHKRVGYIAASQGFTQDTEVILLTTNLLKKELRGAVGGNMQGVYDASVAINCLSNIVTEDLARDLLPELTSLTSHPQPYLRKKAILCLYKLFIKYPQGLRLTFSRLQQSLDDPNSSVVSCAVNVITELSDKAPKQYLNLAPQFFQLLTKSSNNWMLIKVVKLLGSLVAEEPRLARKLLDPLAGIVRSTQAKSLLYESVRTITLCLPYCRKSDGSMPANVPEIVELCANTLLDYVTQTDQNLKYLGLVGFGSLMQSHPKVLSDPKYRSLILACLSDEDVTIRTRALDLLTGLASRKNLVELVSQLLKHVELASGTYKHDLVAKIVEMCSSDKYALLQDFAWYLDILFQLGHTRGIERHGDLLRAQVIDIALRVLPTRPYAVRRSMEILLEGDGPASDDPLGNNGRGKHIMPQILPSLAWTIGEYSDLIQEALAIDPDDDDSFEFSYDADSKGSFHSLVQSLSAPSNTNKLPTSTQKVYLQAAMKVFAAASSDRKVLDQELEAMVRTIASCFPVYMESMDVAVVERACSAVELLKSLDVVTDCPGLIGLGDEICLEDCKEDDLLGMEGNNTENKAKEQLSTKKTSVASKVRSASAILTSLLKPSPMKPCGAKAQRKKQIAPLGVDLDITAPADLSIFESLIAEEEVSQLDSRLSTESVSFTQQRVFQREHPTAMSSHSVPQKSLQSLSNTALSGNAISNNSNGAPSSGNRVPNEAYPISQKQRQADPFYLNSTNNTPDEGSLDAGTNRFGSIQLLDSSDEENASKPKRKVSKRKKKVKSPEKSTDHWLGAHNAESGAILYGSDDDEGSGAVSANKSDPFREFAGLAKVDLTTPLRDDEVLLERKHRVVPERAQVSPSVAEKKKKSKRSHKKSSKKSKADEVGDLLDLGGAFGEASAVATNTSTKFGGTSANPTSTPHHAINSAFDDLLGDYSSPVVQLTGSEQSNRTIPPATQSFDPIMPAPSTSAANAKRPWFEASVKASAQSELEHVSLSYRVYRVNDGQGVGAKMVFRATNRSASNINSLSLDLKDHERISLGAQLTPGGTSETAKVGPFSFSVSDASQLVKGNLVTETSSAPVKLYLPSLLLLNPETEVSVEQVAQELSSSGWTSSSAKIRLRTPKAVHDIKEEVGVFLRAAEIAQESSNSNAATYAARSTLGHPIRFLAKIKDNTIKIDVKSMSESLCKSIASDIKRVDGM